MRRLCSLLLLALLCVSALGLAACGGGDPFEGTWIQKQLPEDVQVPIVITKLSDAPTTEYQINIDYTRWWAIQMYSDPTESGDMTMYQMEIGNFDGITTASVVDEDTLEFKTRGGTTTVQFTAHGNKASIEVPDVGTFEFSRSGD